MPHAPTKKATFFQSSHQICLRITWKGKKSSRLAVGCPVGFQEINVKLYASVVLDQEVEPLVVIALCETRKGNSHGWVMGLGAPFH